ncbi:MAG: hypothetical protein ACJA1A_001993 [Saprospiraceae bacterium]|jgi:hypothetical protein|tara:strand:- start:1656 stop:2132 length:477 start_codon:yes stop_codon:yes gene_type:complete
MKNIITILLVSFISLSVSAQYGVDNIFRKYKNNKGVAAWQFEGNIANMLKTKDGNEIKSSLESVDFVMFIEEGTDITDKDRQKLKEKIASDGYELLVQARDKGQKLQLMGIQNDDVITKVFAQVSFEKRSAYFFLTGKIFLEDLNNIEFESLMQGLNF